MRHRLRRGHEMGVGHAHCPKLLGHLGDGGDGGRIAGGLHRGRVGAIHGLLVSPSYLRLRLRWICPIASPSRQLASKSRIGPGTELECFSSIGPLLASCSVTMNSGSGGHVGLLLLDRRFIAGLSVPSFLGRIAPLW